LFVCFCLVERTQHPTGDRNDSDHYCSSTVLSSQDGVAQLDGNGLDQDEDVYEEAHFDSDSDDDRPEPEW
jgi:hypothetical protein